MTKFYLKDKDSFEFQKKHTITKGIYWYEEEPENYQCLIVYTENDIDNSITYGTEIESEFVYLSDFEDFA